MQVAGDFLSPKPPGVVECRSTLSRHPRALSFWSATPPSLMDIQMNSKLRCLACLSGLGFLFSSFATPQQSTTYPYLNVGTAPAVRYNDGVAAINGMPATGQYSSGDTTACAWADDGSEYCLYTDGAGILPATDVSSPTTSNIGIYKMAGGNYENLSNVNTLSDFGPESGDAAPGRVWSDGFTWKAAGIAHVGGCIYATVMRQIDTAPWNVIGGISLIKSCDRGITWCNYLHASANACSSSSATGDSPLAGQAMWTGRQPFLGWVPIMYCQDNTINCPSVDNNSQYIYLASLGNGTPNWANYYLARVNKADFPLLDVTKYQYWVGAPGAGITNSANWSSIIGSATPIITNISGVRGQISYIAALAKYVLLQDNQHGAFEVWNATSLSGPWLKSAIIPADDTDATAPTIVLSSVQALPSTPPSASMLVQFNHDFSTNATCPTTGCTADPLNDPYSLTWRSVTMTSSTTALQTQTAASYSDGLNQANLLVDYSFLPELSNSITDYSGNGNTGTLSGHIGLNYTNQGLWLNESNGFSLNQDQQINAPAGISGSSAGTSFTLALVFKKVQLPMSGECLLSGSGISVCRSGNSLDSYVISVLGSTTTYTTLPDGSWNELFIVYNSLRGTALIFDSSSFLGADDPLPPLAVAAIGPISGNFTGTNFVLGSTSSSWPSSSLILAKFAVWTTNLSNRVLIEQNAAINTEMVGRGVYLPRAILPGEFPLDFQPPLAAYSVRRLLTSYSGPLMHVVNGTTGATADVYPNTTGALNTATILALCPSGQDCFIDRWYDQSGNKQDMTSVTGPLNMIRISHNGAIIQCGTQPCAYFDGGEQYTAAIPNSFSGLTATANLVFAPTSAWNAWSSIFFGETAAYTEANVQPANWLAINRYYTNDSITWGRGLATPDSIQFGPVSGPILAYNTLYNVWSIYDGVYQRFASSVNSSDGPTYLPVAKPSGLDGATYYDGNSRFQFANLALGTQPAGFAGYVSEAIFFPYAVGYRGLSTLADNQNNYFGVVSGAW